MVHLDLPPATLMVGRSESNCNNCGMNARPSDKSHDWTYGYNPQPGCGITWTHVFSKYMGEDSEQATRNLRPDLEYISVGEVFGRPATQSQ